MYAYDRRKILRLQGLDSLGLGVVGQTLGVALIALTQGTNHSPLGAIGFAIVILATGVLLGGCELFVRYHRLNRWWLVFGFFSLPGILILLYFSQDLSSTRKQYHQGFDVMFAEPYRRDVWRMDVRVILDQSIAAAVREPIMLQLPRGANVGTAMKTLAAVIPQLDITQSPAERFAINGQAADRRAELSHGDELAVSANVPPSARG